MMRVYTNNQLMYVLKKNEYYMSAKRVTTTHIYQICVGYFRNIPFLVRYICVFSAFCVVIFFISIGPVLGISYLISRECKKPKKKKRFISLIQNFDHVIFYILQNDQEECTRVVTLPCHKYSSTCVTPWCSPRVYVFLSISSFESFYVLGAQNTNTRNSDVLSQGNPMTRNFQKQTTTTYILDCAV